MPEGDSLYRLAALLRPHLAGATVRAFDVHTIDNVVANTLVGRRIDSLSTHGKNLLIHFDDGRALHIHLRMLGRVWIEKPRSTYWRPRTTPHQLRLEVESGIVVVGERIPVLRLIRAGANMRARTPDLNTLGPDLLAVNFEPNEAVSRLEALGVMTIGEALLVQRALAGIGNIYKSETLFLEKINPLARVTDLDETTLGAIVRRATMLMKSNLGQGPRITRHALAGPKFWVYGRGGRACLRCETRIQVVYQGIAPGRSTYHCPQCQTIGIRS